MHDAVLETTDSRHAKLPPAGRLLITVPNGYGWFELESALWFKAGVGTDHSTAALGRLHLACQATPNRKVQRFRVSLDACALSARERFTLRGLERRRERAGFTVVEARGSALFCGPFSNLLFTGFRRLMALNVALARDRPALASGLNSSRGRARATMRRSLTGPAPQSALAAAALAVVCATSWALAQSIHASCCCCRSSWPLRPCCWCSHRWASQRFGYGHL